MLYALKCQFEKVIKLTEINQKVEVHEIILNAPKLKKQSGALKYLEHDLKKQTNKDVGVWY